MLSGKAVPIFIFDFVSHLLNMPKPTLPPCKKKKNETQKKKRKPKIVINVEKQNKQELFFLQK